MVFHPEENLVIVQTKGPIDKHSMPAMLKATVDFLRQHQCNLVIGDHRASELKMDVFETFGSPQALFHERADWNTRAALVYSSITENHKFMETVFLNAGRSVALFTDLNAARAWLTAKPGAGKK